MKTPKRYIEIAPFDITEKVYPPHPEHVLEQRFKRKNRLAQLKRTIARQAEEIRNLRVLLTFKVQEEYMAEQKAALEWAAKHICAHVFADHHLETGPDGISQFTSTLPTLKFKP